MNACKHFNTHRFAFVEHAHYPVSLHINLFAGGDAGWVNFVMHCSQKWACVFHFIFHVPALPWVHLSFEAALRLKEPRLSACVCAFVRGRKWGRETVKQQELRTKSLWSRWVSLMSCTSLSEHLSYHYRCGSEWKASSRGSAFLLQQYFLWCFFF